MPSRKDDIKQTRATRRNWLIVGLMLAAITAISFPSYRAFDLSNLEVGRPSPQTYRVNRAYRIRDEERTEQRVKNRLKQLTPKFVEDRSVRQSIRQSIGQNIDRLRKQYQDQEADTVPSTENDWARLRRISSQLTDYLLNRGIIKSRDIFDNFELQTIARLKLVDEEKGIVTKQRPISTLKDQFISRKEISRVTSRTLDNVYRNFPYKNLVVKIIEESIKPTIYWKEQMFRSKVEEIRDPSQWVYHKLSSGDVVLSTGERVSHRDLQLLEAINQQKIRFQILRGLASLGIALLGLGIIYFYLKIFQEEILHSFYKLSLICLLVVILTAITKLVELLGVEWNHLEYVIPFAAPIMLISIMIGPQLAFVLSVFLGFLVVSFFHFTFELFAMFLIGSFAGIFSILRVERRSVLVQSGLLLGAAQVLIVFFFYLLRTGEIFTAGLGTRLFWAGVNGVVLVPLLVIGLLPFLENMFNITTNFKLMELADLNHPLLKELFERAPGTFQHSLMLSNLCERAAREIGANALLVRVGAYYHDLGKGEISEYFIENQGDQDNPHDELKPSLSASILKSHVKKGAELAREAGIPEEIIDLIEQHHGTTTMQFFYHKALEEGQDDVSEEEFQYPGPRPQTREAGICMLGDAVEAATRTLEKPSPKAIREMIEEIVYEKFKQEQLNECDLTLKDLDSIVDTFTRVITSVHHRRIEYPDEMETEKLEKMKEIDLAGKDPSGESENGG